jgi:hypothetical protein
VFKHMEDAFKWVVLLIAACDSLTHDQWLTLQSDARRTHSMWTMT